MKFHEEIDQFIEQFKEDIIGQHFQYLLNTKTMFMNRGGHDLQTTNYGEHFTFCNPEMMSETCACFFLVLMLTKNLGDLFGLFKHK